MQFRYFESHILLWRVCVCSLALALCTHTILDIITPSWIGLHHMMELGYSCTHTILDIIFSPSARIPPLMAQTLNPNLGGDSSTQISALKMWRVTCRKVWLQSCKPRAQQQLMGVRLPRGKSHALQSTYLRVCRSGAFSLRPPLTDACFRWSLSRTIVGVQIFVLGVPDLRLNFGDLLPDSSRC